MSGSTVIVNALAARFGGGAYAALRIAELLADDARVTEVVVVTRRASIVAEGLRPRAGLRVELLRPAARFELAHRVAWEALRLPGFALDRSAGCVLTWSSMLPRRLPSPLICFVANPLPFGLSRRPSDRLRRWASRRTTGSAAHVLVPSAGLAARAAGGLGRAPEVVPLGVDEARFVPSGEAGREVLCVADFYPHKRHDVLLAAWAGLPPPRPLLHLVGDPRVDPGHARSVLRLVETYRAYGPIRVSSRISLEELVRSYQRARVFVSTSAEESFCLPVVEAQRCGVPVVVRDLPALRETGGPDTSFVVGNTPATWAAALHTMLSDDVLRERARRSGLAQTHRFSWSRTAGEVADRIAGL